jgi:hypothetical protein
MIGRGRREAERSRGLRWFAASAGLAVAGATVLAMGPAHANAEAANTTATLTLTGVVDSNCTVSTGGTEVFVAPGGTVTFKAALAGISVNVPLLGTVALDTSTVASFVDTLIIDGDTAHPHSLSGTSSYVLKNLSGKHTFSWSATSVRLLPSLLGGVTVPLNANTIVPSSLPVGAKLAWNGNIDASSASSNCGVSLPQLPGVTATVGPVKVSVPPVALPTISVPSLPNIGSILPGTGKTTGTNPGQAGNPGGSTYTPPGLTIPQEVVPSGDGNGPGTVDNSGFGSALPNLGNGFGSVPSAVTSIAPDGAITTLDPANTQQKAKTVQLAANPSPSAQMPVLLAIIAIIALSLVTATYARLYLLRKPPTA